MGFMDSMKGNQIGSKAYRTHVSAMQLRKQGKYAESEAKLDEAIRMYDQAYKLGFRKTGAMEGYAILLMRRGKFDQAREILVEISKDKQITPEDRFSIRIDFAIVQWKTGKLDKAIETMNVAASTKKNSTVYTTLGMFLVEKARETGEFEEALKFNEEAMEYDDEDPGTLDNMGQLYRLMSEKSKADGDEELAAEQRDQSREFLAKAYELKPDQLSSAYFYALTLHEDGEDDAAREVINNMLEIPFSAILQVTKDDVLELLKSLS